MDEYPAAGAIAQNPIPLEFIRLIGRLKHLSRTGWLRFIDHPESVASHSFRLALLGLVMPERSLNVDKCIFLGLIHDLAESVVGDIPTFANVPKPEKHRREALGIAYVCGLLEPCYPSAAQSIQSGWDEYEAGETPEARCMREMDKLECLEQANVYENETHGSKNLEEFQGLASKVHSVEGARWLKAIQERREKDILRRKQRYPVIFVTGNFSHDDTQFADLAASLGMRHVSLPAVLRNASTNETHLHAKLVAPFLENDDEPPVSLVVDLLDESIQESNSTSGWCLVSGYPRGRDQHHEFELKQKDNYILSVGPAPETKMYGAWKPQKEDFTEGHFAEISMSGPSLKHDTGALEAMRHAVSAFMEHETKA